ncbi:E3 ubiquitin-protein ligase listerin [Cydia strobilella]|uniref:E3 ubiquitin-protein ligase listerin n=1 Tax=Cydia strobilella TaxID=1100964 RepID=UPI0030045812
MPRYVPPGSPLGAGHRARVVPRGVPQRAAGGRRAARVVGRGAPEGRAGAGAAAEGLRLAASHQGAAVRRTFPPAPPSALDIGRVSCRAVYHSARRAGGALRGWWGAAPPRAARALERLLKAYVSPHLIKEQLSAVSAGAEGLEDAEVTVHPSTNEVVVTYLVEDRPLELSVSLGAAHPLPPPRVTAARAPQHTTHWLAVYLAYQNGTVLNAIRMWMDTVAKRVEASPQCYICYCRLQPSTGRLPKVVCHQCRNKFHAECLRKWFQTSSKSNCPLCRANF